MTSTTFYQKLVTSIMKLSNNIVFIISEEKTYLDVYTDDPSNLSIPAAEFLGKAVSDVLPPYLHQPLAEALDIARLEGRKADLEYAAPDNSRWYRGSIVYVHPEKHPAFYVLSVQNISAEKKAAEVLLFHAAFDNLLVHATSTLIQSSEENFDTSLETVLEKIGSFAGVDRAYFFRFSNQGELTMSNTHEWCSEGVTSEKENLQEIPCEIFPEWMACLHAGNEVYIPDVSALPPTWQAERDILEPQGVQSLLVLPVKAEGRLYGFMGFDAVQTRVVWDDSKRRLLRILADNLGSVIMRNEQHRRLHLATEQANLLAQEAMMANRHKSDFLANMSHEIRTPLNGVVGFTELLMETGLSDLQQQYISNVRNSAQSLLELINQILDFSKIEAGKMELDVDRSDLFQIVEKTCALVRHAAHSNKISFILDVPVDIPRYYLVDAVKLQQVLANLLSNAFKFTQEGKVTFRISYAPLETDTRVARLMFSVADTGIGIASESQKRIFQAFAQADISTTRKYGGTGLGLAISNSLLQMMNSTLHLESCEGKGSTFSFTLDLPSFPGDAFSQEAALGITKALVVEADPLSGQVLVQWLAHRGIQAREARNATEALAILAGDPSTDLLVLNENLPTIKGLQLLQMIRSDLKRGPETLKVVLLQESEDALAAGTLVAGVRTALARPVTPTCFFAALDALQTTPVATLHPEAAKKQAPVIKPAQQGKKILIAEDNATNMLYTRLLIQHLVSGAQIVEARNGQEALEAFRQDPPHLILMDLQMPLMSGDTATREIRLLESRNGNSHTPIIAFTANAIKGVREQCIADGFDDYLTKPVNKEQLWQVMERFM